MKNKTETVIIDRIKRIQEQIETICFRNGKLSNTVKLLPVTKTCLSTSLIRSLGNFGLQRFAESRVQEICRKSFELSDLQLEWIMIGHLQTNKVKHIAKYAKEVQSIDRLDVAYALNNYLKQKGKPIKVLVQVKTSDEESKYGVPSKELIPFLHLASRDFSFLKIIGLMTMAKNTTSLKARRNCFRKLYKLREYAKCQSIPRIDLCKLSMGMSDDFEIAIEEGSTEIRIGRAIFGELSF